MSADVQPFSQEPRRRPRSRHQSERARDRNLGGVFAFVQRWAARSRIDDKLTRLQSVSPESFRDLAPRIEAMVDEALAALPSADAPGRRSKPIIRLTWMLVAVAITIGLIIVGQQLALTFRAH
jgi:hypothetical protein